jgi:vacuolar protein sorting-associated protein 13A/C
MDPRIWFQYAAKCIVSDIHEKSHHWTWDHFKKRRDDRLEYVELYSSLHLGVIDEEDVEDLKLLELKLSYDDIRLYRHLSMQKIKAKRKSVSSQKTPTSASSGGWFGWLAGGQKDENKENDDWNAQLQKIYANLELESEQLAQGVYPLNAVRLKVSSKLASGSFTLRQYVDGQARDIAFSRFENLRLDQISYPKSYSMTLKMEHFVVSEPIRSSPFSTLIEAKHSDEENSDFFTLFFEHIPLDGRADDALAIKMLPLRVAVNPNLLSRIFAFFKPKRDEVESISRLQAVAVGAISGVTAQSKAGMIFAIEEHKTLDLSIEADAPIFILPSEVAYQNAPILILDAGHLHVKSNIVDQKLQKRVLESTNYSLMQLAEDIYDKFTIDFTKAKIMLATLDPSSVKFLAYTKEDHFLEDLDLSLRLDLCILPNAPEFTKAKFFVDLPRLHVNVSEKKMLVIKRVTKLLRETFLGPEMELQSSVEIWTPSPIAGETPLAAIQTLKKNETQSTDYSTPSLNASQMIPMAQQTLFEFKCEFRQASVSVFEDLPDGKKLSIALFEVTDIDAYLNYKLNDVKLQISLGSVMMQDLTVRAAPKFKNLISSDNLNNGGSPEALVRVDYQSHTSATDGETVDMTINILPIKFILARECILRVYHAVMAIIGPATTPSVPLSMASEELLASVESGLSRAVAMIRTTHLIVKISSIAIIMAENASSIGSCALEGFDLSMNTSQDIIYVSGTIGKLSLFRDETGKCMLLIEEDKALDFEFEIFDSERAALRGYDSSLLLNATSWRFVYDPQFMGRINVYFGQFQEMNSVMDRARKAALETQQQMTENAGKAYVQFNIKTPIIVVPNGRSSNADSLLFFPGRITVESDFNRLENTLVQERFNITVNQLKLQSAFYSLEGIKYRDMIQDVNLSIQYDRLVLVPSVPQTFMNFKVSDVRFQVTNHQYRLFAEILQLINTPIPVSSAQSNPNLDVNEPPRNSHLEIAVSIPKMTFEAYSVPSKFLDPENFSLFKLIGRTVTSKLSTKSNGPLDFELCFSSLSILDTRRSNTAFRDIMIPLKASDDQFVLRYQSTPSSTEYNVTIDRPKLILEVDHILAIQSYATSAWFNEADHQPQPLPNVQIAQKSFKGRTSFIDAEIIVIAQPEMPNTDAVILLSKHLVITQNVVLSVSFQDLGMFFCVMDQREDTQLRFLHNCNVNYTLDDRLRPDGVYVYHASVETTKLMFRVSHQDVLLLNDLIDRLRNSTGPVAVRSEDGTAAKAAVRPNQSQQFRVSIESIQAVLIDDFDKLHMPLFELGVDRTIFEMMNWSSKFEFTLGVSLFANYFNVKNSHWEPLIESSQFSINGQNDEDGRRAISVLCRKKLEINVSHVLMETVINLMDAINKQSGVKVQSARREIRSPYVVRNQTGYPIIVWTDSGASPTPALVKVEDGKSIDWRFEDWRTLRERTAPIPNKLAIQFEGPAWETLKGVSVDREGSTSYTLRPAIDSILHRLVVEVSLEDKIKVVTFRSSKLIENSTNIEIEVAFTASTSKPKIVKIPAGKSYPIPIESAYHDSIYVRPADFGYKWSLQGIHWRDLVGKKRVREYLVNCPSTDLNTPYFNFQLNCKFLGNQVDYPELTLKFMAPFILENLLPFDFRYVIQDKVSRQQHSSTLAKGSREFLHTMDPSHLLALSISLKEKGLTQKESVIITSTDLEYRDEQLLVQDASGNQLTLRVYYT